MLHNSPLLDAEGRWGLKGSAELAGIKRSCREAALTAAAIHAQEAKQISGLRVNVLPSEALPKAKHTVLKREGICNGNHLETNRRDGRNNEVHGGQGAS